MALLRAIFMTGILIYNLGLDTSPWEDTELASFYSPSRGKSISFIIYTPPGYDETDDRYPVLYFLHGRGGNHFLYWASISEFTLAANGNASRWISDLLDNEVIPPLIIIAPDDAGGLWGQENETMITEELINYIDSNWRTIPGKHARAIEGFSMGGMGASYYAASHPDLYCSTIIMAAPRVEDLTPEWTSNREEIISNKLSVRLVVGGEDGQLDSMQTLHEGLISLNITHQFDIVPGVGHNVGQLYNHVGIEGLKFHANCFSKSSMDFFTPDIVPRKGIFHIPL